MTLLGKNFLKTVLFKYFEDIFPKKIVFKTHW